MILVLTPLPLEQEALRAALIDLLPSGLQQAPRDVEQGRVRLTRFDGAPAGRLSTPLITAVGGHGKVQFALTTQYLIQALKPRLVVCTGGCGALSSTLGLQDLVVAEHTIEHDFNLRFISRPLPRFPASSKALEVLKAAGPGLGVSIHFGDIASGDEDVIASVRAEEIARLTGAMAVAWEGAGGARACRFHQLPFLELRTVTDTASESASSDFTLNLAQGMRHVARALIELSAQFESARPSQSGQSL